MGQKFCLFLKRAGGGGGGGGGGAGSAFVIHIHMYAFYLFDDICLTKNYKLLFCPKGIAIFSERVCDSVSSSDRTINANKHVHIRTINPELTRIDIYRNNHWQLLAEKQTLTQMDLVYCNASPK